MMLADCADWYVKFARWYCGCPGEGSPDLALLDTLAMSVPSNKLKFWPAGKRKRVLAGKCPVGTRPELVANAQFSIAVELLARTKKMAQEVKRADGINRFVLTGGLCRSRFFRDVLVTGVRTSIKDEVFVSDRKGPLAFQAATSGALINAMVGFGRYPDLASAISDLCPLRPPDNIWPAWSEPIRLAIADALSKY
jgi:hypothetical protein